MNGLSSLLLGPHPPRHQQMLRELERWVAGGWLRALDCSFARFLAHKAPDADPLLIFAAALASHQLGRGHACLDLPAVLADSSGALSLPPEGEDRRKESTPAVPPSALLAGVSLARWTAALDHPALVGDGPGATPLVRVDARLYLRRYWQYEDAIRKSIGQRVSTPTAVAAPEAQAGLARALEVLFPARGADAIDWQKVACALAARQRFSIITGGPGTGKTTTVVRLLAVLQHLAMSARGGAQRLRIRLAAPTGKAAARLNESIASAVASLPLAGLANAEPVRASIPTEVVTVHRLLGSRPDTRHFRHDARNPLALDVLVVDEASMLDLEMTAALLAALPPSASLILLGDKDQLASVEAGAVLGSLCQRADGGHYRPDTAAWLHATTGARLDPALCDIDGGALDQAVVKLRLSHRFSADSGIGRLAAAVNAGEGAAALAAFDGRHADLSRQHPADDAAFERLVIDGVADVSRAIGKGAAQRPRGYRHYLDLLRQHQPRHDAPQAALDAWAGAVLAAYGRFQMLCALRRGPHGVDGLNARIAGLLRKEGLLDAGQADWYLGRPVLVTRNDYGLGLMNGDVGVTLALPTSLAGEQSRRWILRVAFSAGNGDGGIRWILPSRLRAVETVFAMTVHKSQGSEFDHAALFLPERMSPVLTRELVYTGITRARQFFTLVSADDVLKSATGRRVDRVGGLADGLQVD